MDGGARLDKMFNRCCGAVDDQERSGAIRSDQEDADVARPATITSQWREFLY
jgi:hypothetical protein